MVKYETVSKPAAGDRALHRGGQLDSREVARVMGDRLWLKSPSGSEIGPVPVANYTFRRPVAY